MCEVAGGHQPAAANPSLYDSSIVIFLMILKRGHVLDNLCTNGQVCLHLMSGAVCSLELSALTILETCLLSTHRKSVRTIFFGDCVRLGVRVKLSENCFLKEPVN